MLAGAGALLGDRLGERDATLLTLLLVAGVYVPLRAPLWRLVRRWLFGEREDPYRVVSGLAERLERSDGADEQLMAVAAAVAEAFRSPYVGVEVESAGGGQLVAEHGHRPAAVRVLPIAYRGEEVGRLLLPRDGVRASLVTRDERLLADVVRQAAAAARASSLAAQLQASREQLVAAREEERRRLRRDLHDGLGPSLGAVVLRIDTARNLVGSDPVEADRLLRSARDGRRGRAGRRPPPRARPAAAGPGRPRAGRRGPAAGRAAAGAAGRRRGRRGARHRRAARRGRGRRLPDRLGGPGQRRQARRARRPAGSSWRGTTTAPWWSRSPTTARHRARARPPGVGLVSLRERAAELGGRCTVECPPGGGTVVRAVLPADGGGATGA